MTEMAGENPFESPSSHPEIIERLVARPPLGKVLIGIVCWPLVYWLTLLIAVYPASAIALRFGNNWPVPRDLTEAFEPLGPLYIFTIAVGAPVILLLWRCRWLTPRLLIIVGLAVAVAIPAGCFLSIALGLLPNDDSKEHAAFAVFLIVMLFSVPFTSGMIALAGWLRWVTPASDHDV